MRGSVQLIPTTRHETRWYDANDPAEPARKSNGPRWATSEDWDKYRDVIISLYMESNKTLKEVTQYMVTQHHFHATFVLIHLTFSSRVH